MDRNHKFFIFVSVIILLSVGAFFTSLRNSRIPLKTEELSTNGKGSAATKYLAFQIFTGYFNSEMMRQSFPPPAKDIADTVNDIVRAIGATGDRSRKLGFILGPLSFDNTDDEIRKLIRESFSIALKKDIAVGFHIDDSMFWGRLSHLNSIQNIEWLDWDKTPNTGRLIEWSLAPTKLMPQLCFNSPAVKKEVRKRASLIAEEIKRGLKALKAVDKEHLFLGIIVGWETQIGRDFDTGKHLGYCALTNKGYSAGNLPLDIDEARADIVKEFIEFWSKSITERGIDTKKIFSHTSSITKRNYDEQKTNGSLPSNSYLEAANFSPPETAFGRYHNPGFSIYPAANLFPEIYAELSKNNNPPWASSEGTNIALPVSQGENSMETYLARMFNHGAVLVNIFGWGIGGEEVSDNPFRIEAERKESIDAYRKFLNGEILEETAIPDDYGLQAKVKRVKEKLPQWIASGGNQGQVEPLLKEIERYSKEKNPFAVEKTADKILSIIALPPIIEKIQLDSVKQPKTLISPGISHPKNAAEGLKKFTDAMDILTENGMNLFGFTADWKDLELPPYEFHLQEKLVNPLTLLLPKYPQVKGVVFVLKMIDTNWKPMPEDLKTKAFDDPEVLNRFDALIDAIAAEPSSKRITHILLGNELDGYLGQHPEETEAFEVFYNRALLRIHDKLPGVKVGTIFTAGGVLGNVNIANFFNQINKLSDFIDYTYYPVYGLERGNVSPAWQMAQVSDIKNNLVDLAERAGNKPFAFTEIGYSASSLNGSSEEKQAEFVEEMFRVLTPYQKEGRLEFLLYHNMYDYPTGVCVPYAEQQSVPPEAICSFMENLGLISYETGKPRKGWYSFVDGVRKWSE